MKISFFFRVRDIPVLSNVVPLIEHYRTVIMLKGRLRMLNDARVTAFERAVTATEHKRILHGVNTEFHVELNKLLLEFSS